MPPIAPIKVATPGSQTKTKKKPKRSVRGRRPKRVVKGPRPFKRRRDGYTQEDMNEAIRLVKDEEWSAAQACLVINSVKKNVVPRMTLNDRLKTMDNPALGRPQELSRVVEEALVDCLVMCSEFQYPMKKKDLMDVVQSYCIEHEVVTRWKESRPGKHWIRSFQKRWSHRVKLRKPTNIKRSRAKVGPAEVKAFFERLGPQLEGVPPTHIFNYDESPMKDDSGAEIAFVGAGVKHNEQVMNHSKLNYTVMYCCSAAGLMLPPMVVYKSINSTVYTTWCQGGPPNTVYAATKTGWVDMSKFNQWFTDVLLVHVSTLPPEDIKVIIGDNLAAHLSPFVTELCAQHNIRFIFLPENSTHFLQPLDVTVFGPLKRDWRVISGAFKEECDRKGINYPTLPKHESLFCTYLPTL